MGRTRSFGGLGMSFKPMIKVFGDPAYYPNGLAFTTAEDAEVWAKDLLLRWTQAEAYRVDESNEKANSRIFDGRLFDVSNISAHHWSKRHA